MVSTSSSFPVTQMMQAALADAAMDHSIEIANGDNQFAHSVHTTNG